MTACERAVVTAEACIAEAPVAASGIVLRKDAMDALRERLAAVERARLEYCQALSDARSAWLAIGIDPDGWHVTIGAQVRRMSGR